MFPRMGMGSVGCAEGYDPYTYLTDESGLLLIDPEGNLITEG